MRVAGGGSVSFDMQFLGDGLSHDAAYAAAASVWREKLAPAAQLQLPNPKLQYAFDAALRQMLMLIEARPDHARVVKGLQYYYGTNPYDTFQVSRARRRRPAGRRRRTAPPPNQAPQRRRYFRAVGNRRPAEPGAGQWIIQGLAATALLPLRSLARQGLAARDCPDID